MTDLDSTKVAAARLWAAHRFPYLAGALFASRVQPAPGTGTIAIDRGWTIHADPVRVDAFAAPQLGRLFVHLVSHVVRDHAERAEAFRVDDSQRGRWTRCADAEINDDLAAVDCLPPVAADRPADLGRPDGQLAEQYFAALRDARPDAPPAGAGTAWWNCGSGADGQARSGDSAPDGLSRGRTELLRHSTAAEIQRQHERDPGSVPAGWRRWAEATSGSHVDWRRALRAEIRRAVVAASGSVDYTYRRPSRRHATPTEGDRVVQPSLYRPLPAVAIVVDTSGSMDDDLLAQALAEVDAILGRCGLRSAAVPMLAVDTEVHAVRRVRSARDVRLVGGGGTDMAAGIAAALTQQPRPDVIVVLTDGYTPWPARAPKGTRVVVGVLGSAEASSDRAGPDWARTIAIPAA